MRKIEIHSGGHSIAGVIHPSGNASEKTLIVSHGFRGSKDGGGRAVMLAETVAASGINVVRYDFTPLQNLSCQIAELTSVVDYVRQSPDTQIFLLGRSMGGSASLAFAAADKKISGLILWATPGDLAATFRLALGIHYEQLAAGKALKLTDEYGSLQLTPDFIHDFQQYDLQALMSRLTQTKLLILHGTADAIVPVDQALTLYRLASAPKKLILYPGGDHHLAAYTSQAGSAISTWLNDIDAALKP